MMPVSSASRRRGASHRASDRAVCDLSAYGLRRTLLTSVSVGALLIAAPGAAEAQCVDAGTTRTCTGNQSAGVQLNSDTFTVLNVNDLTHDIAPASGVSGIRFTGSGPKTVNSDTGNFEITATGGARGIEVESTDNAVVVNSTGNVSSGNSRGIHANTHANTAGAATVSVLSEGAIRAFQESIRARSASGAVSVTSTGSLTSDNSRGIFAYSYGSGVVTVTNDGTIQTHHDGIFARSSSGAVTVDSTGDITSNTSWGMIVHNYSAEAVSGTNRGDIQSHLDGIRVRSDLGTVTVTSTGDVTLATASGIRLSGRGSLSASVAGGTVTGAAGAAGVEFVVVSGGVLSGASNSLSIAADGVVRNAGGIGGLAIRGGAGHEAISNSGTVTGSVDLGGGSNSFINATGARFNMGSIVNRGAANALTNSRTMSPGGDRNGASVMVTGNLVQAAGGILLVDVDPSGGIADRVNVSGTAQIAGTVAVNLLNPVSTAQEFTILSATGGVTDNGLALQNTTAATLSLLYPNDNDVVLSVDINLAPTLPTGSLNPNQAALGENLNEVVDAGSGGLGPIINPPPAITDPDEYKQALNQLLPEHYANLMGAGLLGAEAFTKTLMSCRMRDGGFAFIAEGQCLWAEAGGARFEQKDTPHQVRTDEDAWRISAGGQVAMNEDFRFSFAGRYENLRQLTGDFARSSGDRGHLGAAIKYNSGPFLFAAGVGAGRTWYDTTRDTGGGGIAASNHTVDYLNGLLRAAYLLPMGNVYLKPMIDAGVTRVWSSGFTESGVGGLTVADARETFFAVSPSLEIGGQWRLADATLVRPYLRGGFTARDGTRFNLTSNFVNAPAGVGGFLTTTSVDRIRADLAVGVDVLSASGVDFRFGYDGSFGRTSRSHSFGARATIRF